MDGETYKIDWIADITIETDYIVGLHDGCDCRHVGKGAEWLFEFWFGSEILTANIDFAPYAKKNWVTGEINNAAAVINMQTDDKLNILGSALTLRINKNESDIASLASMVLLNETDISSLKSEDLKLFNLINANKSSLDLSITTLIRKDSEIESRIDSLLSTVNENNSSLTRQLTEHERRITSLENGADSSMPIASDTNLGLVRIGPGLSVDSQGVISVINGGEGGNVTIDGLGSAGNSLLPIYINENKAFAITGLLLPEGTVSAKTFKIGNVEMTTDASGNVVIKGNAYTTGWFAAGGIGQPGDGNSGNAGDKVASATTLGMIKVGNGLKMSDDQSGTLNANLGPGLKFDGYGRITVNIGEGGGLEIDSNGILKQTGTNPTPSDPSDTVVGLTWDDLSSAGTNKIHVSHIDYDDTMEEYNGKLSVKYASKTNFGIVKIGSGLTVSNGVISVTNTGGGGDGTVTSVGLSMPSEFSVSPEVITSSGTFNVALKNNYVIPTESQVNLWNKICDLFDIDSSGDVYVKNSRGFYSYSFISAGGR